MSEYPKKMLFITSLGGGGSETGELIPVDVLGENPRISGGLYIRYPHGGSDTTQPRFLFEVPEGLQSENEALRQHLEQAQARCAELEAREDAMCDLNYANGAKQGFSWGQENNEKVLAECVNGRVPPAMAEKAGGEQ